VTLSRFKLQARWSYGSQSTGENT